MKRLCFFVVFLSLAACSGRKVLLRGQVMPTRSEGEYYRLIREFRFNNTGVTCIASSVDGKTVYAGFVTGEMAAINIESGKTTPFPGPAGGGILAILVLSRERMVAASADGRIVLRECPSGRILAAASLKTGYPTALCVHGGRIVVGTRDGKILLFSMGFERLRTHYSGKYPVWALAYHPLSGGCVAGDGGGRLLFFPNMKKGETPEIVPAHSSAIETLAFSPDGTRLTSGGRDRTIVVGRTSGTNRISRRLKGHSDSVLTMAFSPDGRYFVSAGWDCAVFIRDRHFTLLDVARAHARTLQSLCFLPGRRPRPLLCTSGLDGAVRIWAIGKRK